MSIDFSNLPSACDDIRAIEAGSRSVSDVAHRLLERIAADDEHVEAFIHLDRDRVLEEARRLDTSTAQYRGLTFAAKDNFDTFDLPTAYGSPIYTDNRPARDAACVASMRLAGGLLMGKTVSTEFAHVHPGATANPHNTAHTPGGSSSGSAAAVASGMTHIAFGSQTTGSVIRPAAYCGVVGYKPTFGHFNPSGMMANSPSFDTVGVMARDTSDIALVHAIMAAEAFSDAAAITMKGARIGVCQTPWYDRADNEARASLNRAARHLSTEGAQIIDGDALCQSIGVLDELDAISARVSGYEFARTLAHERGHHMDALSDALRQGRMQTGFDTSHDQYASDQRALETKRQQLDTVFDSVDFMISLPAPGTAPAGLQRTGDPIFNMPWTSLHTPSMTLPLFRGENKLPLGLQISSRRHTDRKLIGYAHSIVEVFG